MDYTTVVSGASAFCALIMGGVFLYFHLVEKKLIVVSERKDVESRFLALEALEKEINTRESNLEREKRLLEEQRASLKKLEDDLKTKSEEIEKRKAAVEQAEAAIQIKEQEVQKRQEEIERQAAEKDDEKTANTELSLDDEDRHVELAELEVSGEVPSKSSSAEAETTANKKLSLDNRDHPVEEAELEVTGEAPSKSSSEAEKRKKLIDDELTKLIKEANENELEDPFDEDSIEALKKAAYQICYLKKYYDVMKDIFIYFPSVAKTAINYTLIEEAEKHYFEEDDEFPQDLSIGLRSVATMAISEEDDDLDEDYMLALAQDVVL
jgi:DNA repair exonuclease SbcCD ATPase subunit